MNRFGRFVIVFLVLYLADAGFSAARAGFAVSAFGLVAVLAAILVPASRASAGNGAGSPDPPVSRSARGAGDALDRGSNEGTVPG